MIWAPRYSDRFIQSPDLGSIEAECLANGDILTFPSPLPTIGSFGPKGASQAAVLRRLLEATLEVRPLGLWLDCEEGFLTEFLPRSLHPLSFRGEGHLWHVLKEHNPVGSFVIVTNSKGDRLALLGLPTEEGLDQLTEFAQS